MTVTNNNTSPLPSLHRTFCIAWSAEAPTVGFFDVGQQLEVACWFVYWLLWTTSIPPTALCSFICFPFLSLVLILIYWAKTPWTTNCRDIVLAVEWKSHLWWWIVFVFLEALSQTQRQLKVLSKCFSCQVIFHVTFILNNVLSLVFPRKPGLYYHLEPWVCLCHTSLTLFHC